MVPAPTPAVAWNSPVLTLALPSTGEPLTMRAPLMTVTVPVPKASFFSMMYTLSGVLPLPALSEVSMSPYINAMAAPSMMVFCSVRQKSRCPFGLALMPMPDVAKTGAEARSLKNIFP